jgi:hypothetical protein
MFPESVSTSALLLTPRQDRLESAIARVLRARGTRSELREVVYQLADLFRLQGVPPAQGIMRIEDVATRASLTATDIGQAVGDAPADRLTLIARWATHRYSRAD